MRAIGLVLLSIAIMALLLTDERRSSAQGSHAAGRRKLVRDLSAAIPRSTSAIKRPGPRRLCRPIRFRARLTGPATPGAGIVLGAR